MFIFGLHEVVIRGIALHLSLLTMIPTGYTTKVVVCYLLRFCNY